MTKLEFINKLIDQTIDKIILYKRNIKYFSENNYGEKTINLQKENLEDNNKALDILLKIKTDLQAWKIVKPSIDLSENGEYYKNRAYLQTIDYSESQWLTLKIALENRE